MFDVPSEFFTVDVLSTFAGLVVVLALVVQFTKGIVKNRFGDEAVQGYAFLWALATLVVLYWHQGMWQGALDEVAINVLLVLVNAMLVTMAAVGGYDMLLKKK